LTISDETETEPQDLQVRLFEPADEQVRLQAGQFAMLSVAGQGEIPIGIATSPTEKGFIKFTVNKVGKVTTFLHNMKAGDIMGVRGPMGNWYPWEKLEGKNVVIIGGGFAFTTLRSSIIYMLSRITAKIQDIHVIYGARTPGMLLYRDDWRPGNSVTTSKCTSPWTAPRTPTGSTTSGSSRPSPRRRRPARRTPMPSCAGRPS
jgi:NAD(P)H-flavin reductase